MTTNPSEKIVNFYIDGFNFYFGLRRMALHKPDWRKFYWIDIVKLCEGFLSEDEELGLVTYFTSRPNSRDKMLRQNVFMNCNRKLNPEKLKVVYGRYAKKDMKCNAFGGCKKPYEDLEEKETDVNLAIQMIIDCYENACNKMVLISGDTDFVPPLKLLRDKHKHIETMILFPPGNHTTHLAQICPHNKDLDKHKPKWNKSVLGDVVEIDGKTYTKPESWNVKKKVIA